MKALAGRHSSWLWLAIPVIILGIVAAVSARQSVQLVALDATSARRDGGLALNLWLQRIGYQVSRQSTPVDWHSVDRRDTVMLLEAGVDIPSNSGRAVLRWVRSGGTLVMCTEGDTGSRLLATLNVDLGSSLPSPISVRQPLLLAPPAGRIAGSASVYVRDAPRMVKVAASRNGPVLLMRSMGRGRIWLLTAPQVLENGWIGSRSNGRVLLNLAGLHGRGVLLDEYYPSSGSFGPEDWLVQTRWGVAFFFLLAILVLYRWLSSRRLGPAVVPLSDRYRPAAEYVTSIAGLLRRGGARRDVFEQYQHDLRRLVTERRELPEDTQRRVDALLAEPARLSEQDLVRKAREIVTIEEEVGGTHG